jgi:hypothetical protein
MADDATPAPAAEAPPETAAPPEVAPPVTSSGNPLDMDALSAEVDADLDRVFGQRDDDRTESERATAADARARDERGRFRPAAEQEQAETPPAPEPVAEAEVAPEPVAETPPPPTIDEDALRREALERIEQEERQKRDQEAYAENLRQQAEAERRGLAAYTGVQAEYDAMREALDDDDDVNAVARVEVTDPRTGQKTTGLNLEQAKALMRSWNTARKYGATLGQIEGQKLLSAWGSSLQQAVKADPRLDPELLNHVDPPTMVAIVTRSIEAAVTKTLTDKHTAETTALRKQLAERDERIKDLETDGSGRAARAWAETAGSPDAPGRGGGVSRTTWTPQRVEALSPEEYERYEPEILDFMESQRRRTG